MTTHPRHAIETLFKKRYREKFDLMKLMRSNMLHLIDLKLAGHSPTRTELNIPSDKECYITPMPRPESGCNSSQSWAVR